MMNTYWVLVQQQGEDYTYTYFPSVKAPPVQKQPWDGPDAEPVRPDFTAKIKKNSQGQLQLPTGNGSNLIAVAQVTAQQQPPAPYVLAQNVALFGAVAKTLLETAGLNPYSQAEAGQVVLSVANQTSRGCSLVFQNLDDQGRTVGIFCSPDPMPIQPDPDE